MYFYLDVEMYATLKIMMWKKSGTVSQHRVGVDVNSLDAARQPGG